MVKSNLTPRERIAKARINLLTDYPFFREPRNETNTKRGL